MYPNDTPVPWHTCPECNSTWFQAVLFEESLYFPVSNPGRGNGMTLLVCACGALIAPPVLDPNPVIRDFLWFLQAIRDAKEPEKAAASILDAHATRRKQVETLLPQLQELESAAGQLIAHQDVANNQRLPNGSRWRPPAAPKAAASSEPATTRVTTRGRDWLERQLRVRGVTARAAHDAVTAMFDAIREGVWRDGWVETPIGDVLPERRPPLSPPAQTLGT